MMNVVSEVEVNKVSPGFATRLHSVRLKVTVTGGI